jgi:uncharacterized protein (DUF1810 family)
MADLQKFIEAQAKDYTIALEEIQNGKKESHWMWYIFPQIHGLGFSETSIFYAIKSNNEAEEYLTHPVLGSRLIKISNALLALATNNASQIFGIPDDLKLKSSMTLFASVKNADRVFQFVLDKFFKGEKDGKTIELLGGEEVG